MNRTCFIYTITHIASGRCYVGSAVNARRRWIEHRSRLNCGRHHCQYLQNSWTKYGAKAFAFAIVETLMEASFHERLTAERKWIAAVGLLNLFNSLAVSADRAHFTSSAEARRRFSAAFLHRLATDSNMRSRYRQRGKELAALMMSPAGRSRAGELMRRRWADPIERQKLAAGLLNRWSDPTARERHANGMRALRSTASESERQSSALKAAWKNPIKAARLRKRQQARWLDPEARERQAAKMRAHHALRRAKAAPPAP
jgi:group I intron endonuclease